jgi:hypothetical protein
MTACPENLDVKVKVFVRILAHELMARGAETHRVERLIPDSVIPTGLEVRAVDSLATGTWRLIMTASFASKIDPFPNEVREDGIIFRALYPAHGTFGTPSDLSPRTSPLMVGAPPQNIPPCLDDRPRVTHFDSQYISQSKD